MSDFGQITRGLEAILLWLRPDGGQTRARRNAWNCMVEDGRRRCDRLEAQRSHAVPAARRATSTRVASPTG